jgi:hypothetical protein
MHGKTLVHTAQDTIMTIEDICSNPFVHEVLSYNTDERRFEKKKITQRSLWDYADYFYRITYHNPVSNTQNQVLLSEQTTVYSVNRQSFLPINDLTLQDTLKINTADSQRIYVCPNCGDGFVESPQRFAGHYTWCNAEHRYKTLMGQRTFYRDHPDKLLERKARFIKARRHPITVLEQWVMSLGFPELQYVANGDYGIEIAPNKHYFPDFLVATEPKVVEVGDTEYWHDHDEIRQRIRDYESVGYDCLYLTNEDVHERPLQTRTRIATFLYNHDVPVESIACQKRGMRSPYRYALHVQDGSGYFANGVLVSSCR